MLLLERADCFGDGHAEESAALACACVYFALIYRFHLQPATPPPPPPSFFFFLPRLNASLKIPTSAESGTRFSLSPECLSQSGFFNSSPHRSVSGAGRDIAARESNESLREEQPSSSARESTTAEAFRSRWAPTPPFTTTFSPPRAPLSVNHEVSEPIAASPVTSHSTFQPNKFHLNFEYLGFFGSLITTHFTSQHDTDVF